MATIKGKSTSTGTARKEGIEIDGGYVIITVALIKKPVFSASGKTKTLATTGGYKWLTDVDGLEEYSTIGYSVNVSGKE